MVVLGVETSCDETSAAVLRNGEVLSNVISSQLVHRRYGGVVPELASRAHQRLITEVVQESLSRAGVALDELDGVAATYGPGLVGALLVGLNFGKALSFGLGVPFTGVNHLEGHLYSNFLEERKPEYPFLSLVVSGGHTMLVEVTAPFRHRLLGQSRDDAAGEAFDKVAKMLGLGYPGGPVIDRRARSGNPAAIPFPRAWLDDDFAFSFSGVKTAVLYHLRKTGLDRTIGAADEKTINDICASFQAAVVDVLVGKTLTAADREEIRTITLAGGVAANSLLRTRITEEADRRGYRVLYPSMEHCMDNGAMIAYVGWMQLQRGIVSDYALSAEANLAVREGAG